MRRPRPPAPRILVVSRRHLRKALWINYVGEAHLDLLITFGAKPVIVPVAAGTPSLLTEYAREMDGLLLVEGEDIEPGRYQAAPASARLVEATHPLKDEIEFRLCRLALRRRRPVLGICRGAQILNVVSGGTLYADVRRELPSRLVHRFSGRAEGAGYHRLRHALTILPGTPLARWYGRERLSVNSYHHQGIRILARRFQPMARAEDGLIEGFYDPAAPFVIGLQFHPERMLDDYAGNRRVFRALVTAAKRPASPV
ncbi:MAG TPA: gamma-glutamyl-gamma-aminobutyrate hydrolase family protein [Nitrospiria bacterium]|nr:gamma-glutamyl-gamma-aminobutyrate hydrolase family protein [Nitrospiria bacterium]